MNKDQRARPKLSSVDKSVNTMALPKPKAGHEIVKKPVIASLAGTTKAVCMSQRPQPPAKPRSEGPTSAGGFYKLRHLAQQGSGVENKNPIICATQSTFCRGQKYLTADRSADREWSSSENSEQNGQRGNKQTFCDSYKQQTLSKDRISESHTSSSESSSIRSVKSTSELLEEARLIAGVEQPNVSDQQRAPDKILADTSVMERGHMEDEITDPLQREESDGSLSACEQINKQFFEGESERSCSADKEEVSPVSETHKTTKEQDVCLSFQAMGPTQRNPPALKLNDGTAKEKRSPKPACPPPVSSGVLKMAESVLQEDSEIGSELEERKTLVSPVTSEDIMVAHGRSFNPVQRTKLTSHQPKTIQGLSLLATWTPKKDAEGYKTIHHFCTAPVSHVLPVDLQFASRISHTQNLTTATLQFNQQRAAFGHLSSESDIKRLVSEGLPADLLGVSAQTDRVSHIPVHLSDSLEGWQRMAEFYVERPRIQICGHAATLCPSELRMFWSPAPPKFICAPSVIKDKLFPKYQITQPDLCKDNLMDDLNNVVESVSHVKEAKQENILSSQCKSLTDLRTMESASFTSSGFNTKEQARRCHSAPHLTPDPEPRLQLQSDFSSLSQELEHVRWQRKQQNSVCAALAGESPPNARHAEPQNLHTGPNSSKRPCQAPNHNVRKPRRNRERIKCKTTKRGKRLSSIKTYVCKKLKEPPRLLKRSESLCALPWKPNHSEDLTSPLLYLSLPLLLDFETFASERGGIPDSTPPREWVRDIWSVWFDKLFPPLEKVQSPGCVPDEQQENQPLQDMIQDLDRVDLSGILDKGLTTADLEREVAQLTQALAEHGNNSAFDLCRRGALHIRLGDLSQALEDLNAAISLEPYLLDAHWHRHGIHLLRNDPDSALNDLNVIIKNNKKHADAFMSKAEIYKQRGEITLAIINYSQAIRVKPDAAEIYFQRAKMYEERNEIQLAMEDYAKTFAIDSRRTDAMMIRGIHQFNSSKWMTALEDFSLLLKQEPGNAIARTYRGRIYSKLGHFEKAIEDFSLAVHLNPSDWLAFYHRGCLLRKIKPEMALRDLSTSVLINDSAENLSALLHRGLLYADLKCWREAKADFEAVIKLDRSVAVAHVSLGLIDMLKLDRNYAAIKRFSNALEVDPTYTRVYVCRSRAYYNVNNLSSAVRDLTRAIHMKPDAHDLYIMRGQYLYEMEQFDLATLCIRYAAEMKTALSLSAVQQAVVHSFLGNDANAITCLEEVIDTCPSLPTLVLLGKTLMKEQRFTEAIERFKQASLLLGTKKSKPFTIQEAAEVYYLTGISYMAQVLLLKREDALLLQALDAFNSAVSIKPDYAEAFHQRGLCRAHLHDSTGVQDFNRALNINPNLYQVYLSRAALYGAEGRFAKAVLDCNEAIRVQPRSVRAYLYKGALKFYLKAFESAVENLNMAIQIDPTCSLAYYNRAVCFQQLQDYKQALRDYSIVLLLGSQREIDLKVLINRGLLCVELNDYSNALQDFKIAAQKHPGDATIHHALGVIHHRLGQLQDAMDSYGEAMRLNPISEDSYVGRGHVFMDYGNNQGRKQAQKNFLSALHLNPLCSRARIGLAYNLQVFGFFQRAWNQFTVTVEVNPKCWAAYEGRALINLQMGFTFAALQDMNTAIKCNPISDQLFTNRGLIQQFMGDLSNAMSDYQKAISLNPKFALAYFNAATLFFYTGQFEQAREYYSRAFKLDPSDKSAILNRAITHALLRKVPESLQDFNEALCLNPLSAHVYFNRANLYCTLRDYQSAERDLTQGLITLNDISMDGFVKMMNEKMDGFCALYESTSSHATGPKHDDFSHMAPWKKKRKQKENKCSNHVPITAVKQEAALSLQPGDALLYKLRADVRGRLGWTELALEDYRTAVEFQDSTGL